MHFLFAWRYFRAKKSTNAINIISWVSITAIVIGTALLILVLSVFNGFEDLVKSLYSSFYTDLKVLPQSGKTIRVTPEQLLQLKGLKGVRNYTMVAEEKALVQNGDYQSVIFLKGVDDNYRFVTGVANHIVSGDYDIGTQDEPGLVLGVGVEGALGVRPDQNLYPLRVILPRKNDSEQIDQLNDISIDSAVHYSSSFQIQQDFDTKYGITNIDYLRTALRMAPDEYSGVEINLVDPGTTDDLQKAVEKIFPEGYKVLTRYQQNQSLYSVMNLERWIIYGVLSLILVVAAFNMIGALTMLVLEKKKDINVLHALGGPRSFIQRIFLSEGLLLAGIGTVTGMVLALIIVILQQQFHLVPLEGGSFLIDYFPVKLRVMDFVLVSATVFVIAVIAAWLPSRKAGGEVSLRENE